MATAVDKGAKCQLVEYVTHSKGLPNYAEFRNCIANLGGESFQNDVKPGSLSDLKELLAQVTPEERSHYQKIQELYDARRT